MPNERNWIEDELNLPFVDNGGSLKIKEMKDCNWQIMVELNLIVQLRREMESKLRYWGLCNQMLSE